MKFRNAAFVVGLGTTALCWSLGTTTVAQVTPQAPVSPSVSTPIRIAQNQVEPVRYRMTDQWLSLTDSYVIRNEDGEPVFTIDGRLISLRGQMIFRDMEGRELARIQNKIFDIIDTVQITRDGRVIAEVRPAIVSPLRQSYIIDVPGAGQGVARGDFINHEYEIRGRDSDRVIATVTRRFISLLNAYDIEILPLRRDQRIEDDVIFVATAAAIDLLENTDREPDPPVGEEPPVSDLPPVMPVPAMTCRGTIAANNLDFSVTFSPEGGFSNISFTRNSSPVANARLTFAGRNSVNQTVWRGAVNGMADVILTHLSDQTVQPGDEISVVYDGQSGSGRCNPPTSQPPLPSEGTLLGRGNASGSVFERSTEAEASLDLLLNNFSLSLAEPSGQGDSVSYEGVITQRNMTEANRTMMQTEVQRFASSANNSTMVNTTGTCRMEVFDGRIVSALCQVDVPNGNTQFTGMAQF